ncbi:hypothetical protein XALC_0278 [Xanthomonas albilineans GPE PC73]|uniref:Uncharacterized protein n=1 Tax=Xanthomonas albilineans (strain GPE PC73 / CFBP 7063) TaxID=380358 RepID=D2UAP2_XANAP|nr:hypothetical protein XaFJ1_GM000257 [Xanthomonas albilineans]CBA14822.1 hypothetical protein XALC_0278 [Xanthomonas albilineans GPE PC73]
MRRAVLSIPNPPYAVSAKHAAWSAQAAHGSSALVFDFQVARWSLRAAPMSAPVPQTRFRRP